MSLSALKDSVAYVVTAIHQAIFDLSKGAVFGTTLGMPVLKLTTKGRKSGQPRTTMLTSPVQQGEDLVLVASYGGDDRHPKWYGNLVADADVEVSISGRTLPMRARIATAEEKAALWPKVVAAYSGYAGYQKRTERDIPLVILSPR